MLLPLVESGQTIKVFSEAPVSKDDRATDALVFPSTQSQMQNIRLLLKAQILLCKRHEMELARHRYPAYDVLLRCIDLGDSTSNSPKDILKSVFVATDRATFVLTATELIFRTCLISPQNADELVVQSGVKLLAFVLDFYGKVARERREPSPGEQIVGPNVISEIVSYTLRTLSGIVFFENGRKEMKLISESADLVLNWRRCIDGSIFGSSNGRDIGFSLKRFALEGVANLSKDSFFQEKMVGYGMLWPLLRFVLLYDPTTEQDESQMNIQDVLSDSVASANLLAKSAAARALGMLSGSLEGAPANMLVKQTLTTLLTAPIALLLRNKRTDSFLSLLNSNVERADVIWTYPMKHELSSFLERTEAERPVNSYLDVKAEVDRVAGFKYES